MSGTYLIYSNRHCLAVPATSTCPTVKADAIHMDGCVYHIIGYHYMASRAHGQMATY